ncbi:hypothetical protein CEXT_754901 [Caerostris extrusa]|uniref:Uncharacterized protein n=1 Tax=Caerostris extrusa TaxID=172846 RepID=A0AAV4SK74_CAEEX|nr:hypothetical protein CEXT_754901 [Caerostris extrusa]
MAPSKTLAASGGWKRNSPQATENSYEDPRFATSKAKQEWTRGARDVTERWLTFIRRGEARNITGGREKLTGTGYQVEGHHQSPNCIRRQCRSGSGEEIVADGRSFLISVG